MAYSLARGLRFAHAKSGVDWSSGLVVISLQTNKQTDRRPSDLYVPKFCMGNPETPGQVIGHSELTSEAVSSPLL